jgi:hypothetical protein
LLEAFSTNQRSPSGPRVIPSGLLFAVGTVYSMIVLVDPVGDGDADGTRIALGGVAGVGLGGMLALGPRLHAHSRMARMSHLSAVMRELTAPSATQLPAVCTRSAQQLAGHITPRSMVGLANLDAQRLGPINAKACGSSPPRPTTLHKRRTSELDPTGQLRARFSVARILLHQAHMSVR